MSNSPAKNQPEVYCSDCQINHIHSRGLCMNCYVRNRRNGTLDKFPTQGYLLDPELHIQWGFEHDLPVTKDVALEHGYVIVPIDEYRDMQSRK